MYRLLQRISFFSILLLVLAEHNAVQSFAPPIFSSQSASGLEKQISKQVKPLTFQYTHLEINGMLWQVPEAQVSLVIDPIASQLDFGVPWGYRANKKVLGEEETFDVIAQAEPTHCLLSMGLDDHTHLPTLVKLAEKLPELQFIVAPSARDKIATVVDSSRISVLRPGKSLSLSPSVRLAATEGALVGPPWQDRENGWLLEVDDRRIYMEPHADVTDEALRGLKADVIISPIKEQSLPAQVPEAAQFKLVYGGAQTLEIAQTLEASVIIPLGNGEVRTEGPLAGLVRASGSMDEFEQLVKEANTRRMDIPAIRVERSTPGTPLKVQI